jgi:hypothetical protein
LPGPPIALGIDSCTSTNPSSERVRPFRPPTAVAWAV